jgi:hypothetical protein
LRGGSDRFLTILTRKIEIGPDNKPGIGSCIAPPADSVIDEVAVYDYVLKANQIRVHHLAGTGFPKGMIQQRSMSQHQSPRLTMWRFVLRCFIFAFLP